MTVAYFGNNSYTGVAADTKPTNVPDNSTFYETDTFTDYQMVSGAWKELSQKKAKSDYIIYVSGSSYKAKNNSTGAVEFSTTTLDIGAFTNTIIATLTNGGQIEYARNTFTTLTPIAIPKATPANIKPFNFVGIPTVNRFTGTQFTIGSTFPDEGYIFESVSAEDSGTTSTFRIEGLSANNNTYAATGTEGVALGGGGTVINAGFLKFESDANVGTVGNACVVKDVFDQYMWRGIHLLGYSYYPIVHNFASHSINPHFVGDVDFLIESGTGHDDYIKVGDFRNLRSGHICGEGIGVGTGSMNAAFIFSGGYHHIDNLWVDGMTYNDCVIGFKQCFSTSLYHSQVIDLADNSRATIPGTFKGVYLFDNNEPGGVTPPTNPTAYETFNNQIYEISGSPSPYTIAFRNSPFRNTIRVYAYYGNHITIDDAAAGAGNIVELIDGQQPVATTNNKITSTNSLVKLIDKRVGAENKGLSTQSGDNSTKVFNITHSCFTTPVNWYVYPITADAVGAFDVTVSLSNIIITYGIAPPTGTNNLKWSWWASVY